MNQLVKAALLAATATCLAAPFTAWASEEDGVTEKEVISAEGTPPLTPHSITREGELRNCLSCHEEGKNGAPQTPHPERLTCTQCHGQGEIRTDLDKPAGNPTKK
jgi:nitrate reductase cytochrome c-type subunit